MEPLFLQVVGRWTVRDSHLRDHLKKVWMISKEFDSLFMEFIPKDQNVHADRIANAAIDKELQIQEVVTEYFDRSSAWPSSSPQIKEPAPASPPGRILTPFSNLKLRPVSPLPHHHPTVNNDITGGSKPLASALKSTSAHVMFHGDDVQTSDSELTRTIKSLSSTKADRFWHRDMDRLSISDESSTTASEEDGYFKPAVPEGIPGPATVVTTGGVSGNESGEDAGEEEQEFCKPACAPRFRTSVLANEDPGVKLARSTIQLSEADCDRLVSAVIERLKKNKLGAPAD